MQFHSCKRHSYSAKVFLKVLLFKKHYDLCLWYSLGTYGMHMYLQSLDNIESYWSPPILQPLMGWIGLIWVTTDLHHTHIIISPSLFLSFSIWILPYFLPTALFLPCPPPPPTSGCVYWCMCILIRSQRGDFVIMFILIGSAITPLITPEPPLHWTMAVCGWCWAAANTFILSTCAI